MKIEEEIRKCTICSEFLPLGPRPIISLHSNSKVAIIGQAPGIKVHNSGVPWDDSSGKRLRDWMNVTVEDFYNPEKFAILPMGFCYPGKGKSGDLPPRQECAEHWHKKVFNELAHIKMKILIGSYALAYYWPNNPFPNLTATVQHRNEFPQGVFVLPHPSPRNNIWLKKNPWFIQETVPALRKALNSL